MTTERFVCILAGGSGTRLWPLSRSGRPKQLLRLVGEGSLLRNTFERVRPLVPPERVFILTEASHAEDIRRELPEVPAAQVLVEPTRRGTAASLALPALIIHRRSPDAVWASLHSDAYVEDDAAFRSDLDAAMTGAAELPHLFLLGVRPSFASTQYGYMHAAERLRQIGGHSVYRVERFVEKPDRARAEEYVRSGQHYWNPGIFVWGAARIVEQFRRLQPEIHDALEPLAQQFGTPAFEEAYGRIYPSVKQETIDTGIMERASEAAMIPATFGWSDIGSWKELYEALEPAGTGNAIRAEHVGVDTERTLIVGGRRLIATVGVEDLVIVDTDDALFVCRRDRAADVRQIVQRLEREGRTELL